ncbi:MAG: ABC transporter ATP-binding protein/permease, partial [Acholeplasmatales bacterium]|nr:ABC transporter ATP-binding protein/permease [Acholeplasmatales bacterium]
SLNKGESLGIIGPTGAGKTTLINLLMRFYEFEQGHIFIYGQNIQDLAIDQWRSRVGLVLQADVIFSSSFRYNVDFGRSISDEDFTSALKIASAEFALEEKDLSAKGKNISGGQKQRIMIARAIASKPDLLILDDSSSALDYVTEKALRDHLASNLKETTKITISSRVASIMHCDKIIVLEDGAISACGNHQELMQKSSYYRILAAIQLDAMVGVDDDE